MISERLDRLGRDRNWKPQEYFVQAVLAVALVAATAAFTLEIRAPVITRTVHVGARLAAGSPAQVAQAWGQPSQQIPANQVNQNLPASMTCYIWASKRAMLCY